MGIRDKKLICTIKEKLKALIIMPKVRQSGRQKKYHKKY